MQATLIKKMVWIVGATIAINALYIGPLKADEATTYLKQIADNTANILIKVNEIPDYIVKMLEYALNVQKNDDSQSTKDMQSNFATTGTLIVQNAATQLAAQPQLNKDLLGPEANKDTLPNSNDLVYSTILGQPMYPQDPRNKQGSTPSVNPPYNYLRNVAGMTIPHMMPRFNWRGEQSDFLDYFSYYNTVIANESFNGYILSNQLAELKSGNGLSTAQATLVTQAS